MTRRIAVEIELTGVDRVARDRFGHWTFSQKAEF
jgi:hypothetical protein